MTRLVALALLALAGCHPVINGLVVMSQTVQTAPTPAPTQE